MARISSYVADIDLTGEDLLLGSSYAGEVNGVKQYVTKSYSLGQLSGFFSLNVEIDGQTYDISKISSRVDNLQDMFTYDVSDASQIGAITGLSNDLLGFLNTWGDARFGSTAFQDQLDDHISFDGNGNIISMSSAFADFVVTTTASERFAESSVVTSLGSTVQTINTELGSAQIAISNAQSTLSTHASDISAGASKIESLGASFGTFDGDTFSISEASMTSIVDSLTLENYATTSSVTTLTSTVNQKPDIYRQASAPSTDVPVGSLWFDTDDENKLYVLVAGDPNVWEVTTDQSAANIPSIFRQDDEPTTLGVAEGSLWFDTNDNNKLYVFSNDTWTSTDDTRIATNATTIGTLSDELDTAVQGIADNVAAIGLKPNVYRQDAEPTGTIPNLSIWYDTDDNNKAYAYVNSAWVSVEDARVGGLVTSLATAEDNIETLTTDAIALASRTQTLEGQFTFENDNITGVAGALSTEISSAAATAAGAVASDLDKLETVFSYNVDGDVDGIQGALSTAVTTHATTAISNADLAAAADVTELKTQYTFDVDGNITGVADTLATTITTAQSDAESASASKIGVLAANFFSGYDTGDGTYTNVTLSDAIQTSITNLVSTEGYAEATRVDELETQYTFDVDGNITGVADTLDSVISTARSDAESASATKIGTLAANFFTGYDTGDGTYTAVGLSQAIQDEISSVISGDGYAAASDLNTLTVTVEGTDGTGGLVGSVSTLQGTVASKPEIFRQDDAPATTEPVGSLWYDTNDNNKAYILVAGDPDNVWTETRDEGLVADIANKPFIFRQDDAPAVTNPVGSLWYDTNDGNKLYVLTTGTPNTWNATVDSGIAAAQSTADGAITAANTAQETADGRPKVFRQTDAPATTEPEYSIWYDTDDSNKAYVLVAETWTETVDGRVGDLLDFVESSYSLSTDANGVVTGMELYSYSGANQTLSQVTFTADKFVIKQSTSEATPFVLDGDALKLNVPLNGVSGSFSGDISAATGTFSGDVNILDGDNDTVVKVHDGTFSAAANTGTTTTFPNISNHEITTWSNNPADITYVEQIVGTGSTISSLFDDDNQYLYSTATSVDFDAGSHQHTITTAAINNTIVELSSNWNGFMTVLLGVQFGNSDFSTIYLHKELHREQILASGSMAFPATSTSVSLGFASQTTVYVRFYWRRLWKTNYGTSTFYPRTLDITSDLGFVGKKGRAELSPNGVQILNTDDIYFKIDRTNFTSGNPYVDIGGDVRVDGDFTVTGNINIEGDVENSDVSVANLADRLGELSTDIYIGTSAGINVTLRDNLIVEGDITLSGSSGSFLMADGSANATTYIPTSDLLDEDTFASNSATKPASQQSIKAYVDNKVATLVDSAPATLDTLNELAAALGDDPNFASTTSTALGNRLRVDTALQGLTSTQKLNGRTNLGLGTFATKSTLASDEVTYDNSHSGMTASNVHSAIDELFDTKLGINALTSAVTFYPTDSAHATIANYYHLVTSTSDPDYDTTAVDISTGAITGADILVGSLASDQGILEGSTGIITITTIGNIKRVSGNDTASFYFKVFHRTSAGTETLVGTSGNTAPTESSTYEEFSASAQINSTTFNSTDRIVLKFYGSKTGQNQDPVYNFQYGGTSPVRTLFPVPVSVISHENDAADIAVATGAFDGLLSGADDNVQQALQTLDNVTLADLGYTGDTDANNYSLPVATASTLGGIKVGDRLSISSGVLQAVAQTDNNFSTAYKNKLDGIADNANNYALPTATASVLGGVKIGDRITISSGVISADSQTEQNFTTTLKNKLDGIEIGATGDQTAAEILTAIKTVDGALSGLDADKLDGQEGGYYTNASNLSSGTISNSRLPSTITASVMSAHKLNGNLTTVTLDAQDEVPLDLNTYTNFYCDIGITGWRGFDLTTLTATAVGNSGTIILHNGGTSNMTTGTPFNWPTEFKTPNGDAVVFARAAGTTAILSYFVVSTSVVLINYIGNYQ